VTTNQSSGQADKHNGMQKLAHLFLLVSALVVFAAFIIRDEFREQAKDLGSSIDSAETFFATRGDNAVVAEQLKNIEDGNDQLLLVVYLTDAEDKRAWLGIVSSTRQKVLGISKYLGSLDAALDNIRRLLAKLPTDSTQTDRASAISVKIADLRKKCDDFAKELEKSKFPAKVPSGNNKIDQWVGLDERVSSLESEYLSFSGQIQSLSAETLDRARKTRGIYERQYQRLTWVSIGLFSLGWVIALVGKLYGLDVFGA
jgi:hypothetical protein